MTKAPPTIMYASIVSRETVRMALVIATLNNLQVELDDIFTIYLQAPVTEKVWTTLGLELDKVAGKTAVIVKALYGLKSAGAAFRSHHARCMESFRYESCKAGPIYDLNQKSDQKMGKSITLIYCAMLMTFYASITM